MSLSILCGPFQPALEDAFIEHLTRRAPGPGRRVTVVTASQKMAERLQRLVAFERGVAAFNLRFVTFHGFALDVLRESGEELPAVVNDDLFHEKLVEGLLVEEGAFPPERARALAGAHRATLRDLVEAGVDTASFRDHFGDMEIPGEAKLQRLLDLADRYREGLAKRGVATSADLARRAARCLEDRPDLLADSAEYLYYGFYDLNGAQADFFAAVAKAAPVTLFFPSVKDHPGWAFAERFLDLKLRVGGAAARRLPTEIPGPARGIVDRLFDPGPPGASGGPDVRVFSVSGARDEVWRVAKEILALRASDPDMAWRRVGVVARTMEPYAAVVADVFADHGIPVALSDQGPLIGSPAARLALDLLRLPDRPRVRDGLSDVAGSPSFSPTFLSAAEREDVLQFLRGAGPRSGRVIERAHEGPGEEVPDDLRPPSPPASLRRFEPLFAAPAGARSWREWTQWAARLFQYFIAPDESLASLRAALEDLLERLARLDRVSPPIERRAFVDAFADALGRERRPGLETFDGVRVMGAMDARGESFDTLFLLGLNEGVFPRAVREDPLLTDEARRLLRDPGGYWILPKTEGYDEEKLLFVVLVGAARRRLWLSYSRSGPDGRTESPSLYLREFLRATGRGFDEIERVPRAPLEKWNAVPAAVLTPLEAGLADVLEKRRPPVVWADFIQRGAEGLSLEGNPAFHGTAGRPDRYLERARTRGLSPSALETYALCPFKFFMSRVLSLEEARPLFNGDEVDPRFLGKIRHEILFRVFGSFAGHERPEPETVAARTRAETARVFQGAGVAAEVYPRLWAALQKKTEADLLAFVRRDLVRLAAEGFRPERLEWTAPLTTIDGVPWTGRLDRVDWNPRERWYRVVDYKNSLPAGSLAKSVADGWSFQAPLYLEMIESAAPWGEGVRSAGARLESLAENETRELTAEGWTAVRAAARDQRRRMLNALAAGRFPIRPGDERHCRFCDFARACRKAHGPSRDRGERDNRATRAAPPVEVIL